MSTVLQLAYFLFSLASAMDFGCKILSKKWKESLFIFLGNKHPTNYSCDLEARAHYVAQHHVVPYGSVGLFHEYTIAPGSIEIPEAVVKQASTSWEWFWDLLSVCICPVGCGSSEEESKHNGTLTCIFNITECRSDYRICKDLSSKARLYKDSSIIRFYRSNPLQNKK